MLKKILLILAALIAALLLFAATRPNSYSVERQVAIKAPPEKVFALIDSFPAWKSWSPYERLDPNMQRTVGGPPSGVGATYAWSGNSQAGAGSMRIIEATAPQRIVIQLEFTKPLVGHDTTTFLLSPRGDSTVVTWQVRGPNPYIAKLLTMFVPMDKMLGPQFEEGLGNLKRVAQQ